MISLDDAAVFLQEPSDINTIFIRETGVVGNN